MKINEEFLSNNDIIESTYNEKCFHFCNDIFNIKDNTDIVGFLQSYKYFDFIRDILLEEFNNKNLEILYNDIIGKVKLRYNKQIVSIHVRRGDYFLYPNIHPVCTKKYYKTCMDCFDGCVFLVFSDDIEWCKSNIKANYIEYVQYDENIDLILMSKCDHNIISNSSFSWWAAWLNKNENKIIKYPNIWFGKDGPQDTFDLIPNSWNIVEC